jgi:hypothetical protein
LGFLTALGTIRVLTDLGHAAALHWTPRRQAVLTLADSWDQRRLAYELYLALVRKPGAGAKRTLAALEAWDEAKKRVARKRTDLKKRHLRGQEAEDARAHELDPLLDVAEGERLKYLTYLRQSAPDPSVTLGKNLTATNDEFQAHCKDSVSQAAPADRRWADLCAAFGVADPDEPDKRMSPSPFALVSGSGHQDFLGSVQALMIEIRSEHVEKALFGPWQPRDEKYSLRLDALDDRRYAVMDRDPAAWGNKPRTLWGANRLAFEALRFFVCMPYGSGSAVTGWRKQSKDEGTWRWPLWSSPLSADVVRVLLSHPDLWRDAPEARQRLRAMGCITVLTSQRIRVGTGQNVKFNLTPGVPVW